MSAVTRAVPGRAFVAVADRAAAARLTHVAAAHEWSVTVLPAAASPLGDLPPYADRTLLDWIARQTRPASAASANAK